MKSRLSRQTDEREWNLSEEEGMKEMERVRKGRTKGGGRQGERDQRIHEGGLTLR